VDIGCRTTDRKASIGNPMIPGSEYLFVHIIECVTGSARFLYWVMSNEWDWIPFMTAK
jgi:hypothetical protein